MDISKQVLNLFADDRDINFSKTALDLFKYQAIHNIIYRQFLEYLSVHPAEVTTIEDIPLLPISAFKHHVVKTGEWEEEKIFYSSGTTSVLRSTHYIRSLEWYEKISELTFQDTFSLDDNARMVAMLPSYMDNPNSSLIHMCRHLMSRYNMTDGELFISDQLRLREKLKLLLEVPNRKVVLIGVSFALLDFAERQKIKNKNLLVVYTGGMKNRRAEITAQELIERLRLAFPDSKIYSEYGMTEMQSQCYGVNGVFKNSPTYKVMPKEITDPMSKPKIGKAGRLGFVDLANKDSCAFILTDDLCIQNPDSSFEVVGRMDDSDLRGCNLLYQLP